VCMSTRCARGAARSSGAADAQSCRAVINRGYRRRVKRSLSVAPEIVRGMMALVAIAERRSFAAAAAELGLSASAVSKLVSRMEARTRTRLVHRTTRAVKLTELGLLYCERARRVLEELDASERTLEHAGPEPKGTMRITAPVVLGHARVLPIVIAFGSRYPEVRIVFDATDRIVDLIEERVDVAVRMIAEPPAAMVARKLDDDVRHLCASPAYLARRGTPRALDDLARHDCLPFLVDGAAQPWRVRAGDRSIARSVDGRLHLSNTLSLRDAAIAGLGIADLPRYLIEQDLADGRLVQVLAAHAPAARGVYVLHAPSPFTPAKVRLFVEALRAGFRSPAGARA
jgi:DNA-binding transcriptional LysR family regulator